MKRMYQEKNEAIRIAPQITIASRESKMGVLGQIHHIGNFYFLNRFANEFSKETIKWAYTSKQ